jgi:hypothetical protein
MTPRIHTAFAIVSTVVVVAAVVRGFAIVGSPATKRAERLDDRRLDDLRAIAREIQTLVGLPQPGVMSKGVTKAAPNVASNKKVELARPLPKTLDELQKTIRTRRLNLRDPQTDQPYGYTIKSQTTYELCATFTTQRDSSAAIFWNHAAGEACFTINVLDPPPLY